MWDGHETLKRSLWFYNSHGSSKERVQYVYVRFWVLRRFLRVRNFRVADETVERRFRNFEHGSKSNFQNFNNLQTPKRSIQKTMKYNTVRGRGTRKQWRKVYFRFGVTNRWLRKGFGQAEAGEPTSAPVSAPF